MKVDFLSAPQATEKTEFFNTIGTMPPLQNEKAAVWSLKLPMAGLESEPAIFRREPTVGFGRTVIIDQSHMAGVLRPKPPLTL